MEYLYAAMLLHKAGKPITEEALDKILSAAGVTVDKTRAKATATALKDVDIEKVISNTSLMAAAPAASAPSEEASKAEAKKEETKEEDKGASEEEAAAGLGALFG